MYVISFGSLLYVNVRSHYIIIFACRWLITRIMLGAGLIKIRGDQCWRDFTCMNYFYETQPNPNPIAYYAHQAPEFWHKLEVLGNHLVELVCPLLAFVPFRSAGMINGAAQIAFQTILILTGNLSFLNWLTAVPAIWFFDDAFWTRFASHSTVDEVKTSEMMRLLTKDSARHNRGGRGAYRALRYAINLTIGAIIAWLSVPIVANLLSSRQVMNTSFEPFRIVNTYGAFGSVTKERSEIVFEGTSSAHPSDPSAEWREYEFKCKPGRVDRRPCLISPYHYRLDWLMWFAAFQDYQSNPWLLHLAGKMLDNDPVVNSLLETNPFKGKPAPKYVRISHYQYRFTKAGTEDTWRSGQWWRREYWKGYMPAVSRKDLEGVYRQFGWTSSKSY